jgi:hypothetical protein
MGEWRLRPGEYVVQVVYREADGTEHVMATADRPATAARLKRRLERKYGEAPPRSAEAARETGNRARRRIHGKDRSLRRAH